MKRYSPTEVSSTDVRTDASVLITGASGVVGQPLLARLPFAAVRCLSHSAPVSARGVEVVVGDIRRPRLGLTEQAYRQLAASVDVVVHSAAVTDFERADLLWSTNVDGTARVLDFVADAEAALVHVSTAFLETRTPFGRAAASLRYAESKRAAEQLVTDSGLAATVVRPSIVVGDAGTGEISRFQGIYKAASAVMAGVAPVAPVRGSWLLDVVPRDIVAEVIAAVVRHRVVGETFWVTAGERALPLAAALDLFLDVAAACGRPARRPKTVDPEVFHRLIAPVFLPALPAPQRKVFVRLVDNIGAYLRVEKPFPSSIPELHTRFGVSELPDIRLTLRRSLEHWAAATGFRLPESGDRQVERRAVESTEEVA